MVSRSALAMVNRPDAHEIVELPKGVDKVRWEEDPRALCCGIFYIHLEDHTLGNLIRMQLLNDPQVIFAGYKQGHPLEYKIEMRIQTTEDTTPVQAFNRAANSLINDTKSLINQIKAGIESLS